MTTLKHTPLQQADSSQAQDPEQPVERASQLMEQLMQIARASALEEMVSGIAHELNQPIGAIATFAQAGQRMLDRPQPMIEQVREVLQHIADEALHAGQGIHRIRKLFDDREIPRNPCEIADVLNEIQPLLEVLATRCGMRLETSIAAGLPPVLIDRRRIQHVLFTLVQNALEAPRRDSDPALVSVSIEGDRYAVVTSVIDWGLGLSPLVRDNLFRPFFTTKRHGTGLGLASSRAIIEAHEGSIGCDSAEDGRTRFWFRLPAYSGAAGE